MMIPAKLGPPMMENVYDGIGSSSMMISQQQGQFDTPGFSTGLPHTPEFQISSENVVDGDNEDTNPRPKKKPKSYHRHTPYQIQEMEALFKVNQHPDDSQRKDLGVKIGLDPIQIKFWFQNKRTQLKNKNEKHDNSHLRTDNHKLRIENERLREALANATCPTCGGPIVMGEMSPDEQQLRLHNAELRQQVEYLTGIASKYGVNPHSNPFSMTPSSGGNLGVQFGGVGTSSGEGFAAGPNELPRSVLSQFEIDESIVVELAVLSAEELMTKAKLGEPLWVPAMDGSTMMINEEEYARTFPKGIGPKPDGFNSEASKETAMVFMNPNDLVGILMNTNNWSYIFSGIVSNAVILKVLSSGVGGNYDGALQLMSADFYLPSPMVPARESRFLRYCKRQSDGIWVVVDASIDRLLPDPDIISCLRRPSGCLIREMPNGWSEVTWVEHVEIDDSAVHTIYKSLFNSGHAFGAKKWMASLQRQLERFAIATADSNPSKQGGVIKSVEGRKSIMKLAGRLMTNFCSGASASTVQTWTTVPGTAGACDVKVMMRKYVGNPGRPTGIVLIAANSFWLPVSPNRVFDYLRDETSRSEWDVLSNKRPVEKIAHISSGHDLGNSVSLLRVNSDGACDKKMIILQESCTDSTGSYLVYAPIDIPTLKTMLSGGDPDIIPILPSGFAILPDDPSPGILNDDDQVHSVGTTAGCIVTAAFQILVDSRPHLKLPVGSVETINTLLNCTIDRIKSALVGDDV